MAETQCRFRESGADNMNGDNLDKQISECYKSIEKNIQTDSEEAYNTFLYKLNKEFVRKPRLNSFFSCQSKTLMVAGLALAFFLGSIFTGTASATVNYVRSFWTKIGNNMQTNIDINNETAVPDTFLEEFESYSDVIKRTSFEISKLNYIPEGISLDTILFEKSGAVEKLVSHYSGNKCTIKFTQWQTTGTTSSFSNIDESNSQVIQYSDDNLNYNIILFDNGQILCKYIESQNIMILETNGIEYDEYILILSHIEKA